MHDKRPLTAGRRIFGFGLVPAVGLVAPLLVLPVLARSVNESGWAALAVGQSIGALSSLVVSWGWDLSGPSRIARADPSNRTRLLGASLAAQATALAFTAPATIAFAALIAPQSSQQLAVAMAMATAVQGISPSWYAIGLGTPSLLMKYQVAPKMIASGISVLSISLGAAPIIYPLLLGASSIIGELLFCTRVGKPRLPEGRILPTTASSLRRDLASAATVIAGGGYSVATILFAAPFLATRELAELASADRLYRLMLQSVSVMANAFQSWVIHPDQTDRRRRAAFAITAHVALGLCGAVALTVAGAWATRVLFGDQLASEWGLMVVYAGAFWAVSLNTALGRLVLVPLHQVNKVLHSTIAGVVVGAPAIAAGAYAAGPMGAAAGLLVGEIVVCAVQLSGLKALRTRPS